MLRVQPLSNVYPSPLFDQKNRNGFQLGHFDRFINGYGEIICSESGSRYIFGPESIDLGPCCNPCDENWIRILKNGNFRHIFNLIFWLRLHCCLFIFLLAVVGTWQVIFHQIIDRSIKETERMQ